MDCELVVSRKYLALAKQTVCGETMDGLSVGNTIKPLETGRTFTVHLNHGAKKSIVVDDPNQPLENVLTKICVSRGMKIDECQAQDRDGKIVSLKRPLKEIPGWEIIFTSEADREKPSALPPFIDDIKMSSYENNLSKMESKKVPLIKKLSINNKRKNKIDKKKDGDSDPMPGLQPANAVQLVDADSELKKKRLKAIMDQYEIGDVLGNGAFSVVKSARHKESREEIAIKIVSKKGQDKKLKKRFMGEIEIMSTLQHPNIIQFYDIVEDSKNFYVLLEKVRGGELFDEVVARTRFSESDAAPLLAQILNALLYLHEVRHCVHRDLKPENLLFKDNKFTEIKLADFGEAKNFQKSVLNTYCGTPDYMAPEVVKSLDHGPQADMWSLGAVAYVMMGGFPPFDGQTDTELFDSILNVRYSFPSPEWDHASPLPKDFISKLFVFDPNERMTAIEALDHPFIRAHVPPDALGVHEKFKKLRWGNITEDVLNKSPNQKRNKSTLERKQQESAKHKIFHDSDSLSRTNSEELTKKIRIEEPETRERKSSATEPTTRRVLSSSLGEISIDGERNFSPKRGRPSLSLDLQRMNHVSSPLGLHHHSSAPGTLGSEANHSKDKHEQVTFADVGPPPLHLPPLPIGQGQSPPNGYGMMDSKPSSNTLMRHSNSGSKSPRGTAARITRGTSQPRPRQLSHGSLDDYVVTRREEEEKPQKPSLVIYDNEISREKITQLREVLGNFITSSAGPSKTSDLDFLAGCSQNAMAMRRAVYAYPASENIGANFDYSGFLESITQYIKFLLRNFNLFESSVIKERLMKGLDGFLRLALAYLDALRGSNEVTNQMILLQEKWESLLHVSSETILVAFRDQAEKKQRIKKIRAVIKAAIVKLESTLHEITAVLREVPFDEKAYRGYLGILCDIYTRVQNVLIDKTRSVLTQLQRNLLLGSKYLSGEDQRVSPERRVFIEKEIVKTIKLLLLARYDNLAAEEQSSAVDY